MITRCRCSPNGYPEVGNGFVKRFGGPFVSELEEKAQTVLTGRTTPIVESGMESVRCAVDGCFMKAGRICEVKVTDQQLVPASEQHGVPLCDIHYKAFDTLTWEWRRRTDGAASPQLKLEGVYDLATEEDT